MKQTLGTTEDQEAISNAVIDDVCSRLADNKRIHQPLPGGGMLEMDRLLPFLCVYRRDPARRDEGTYRLVTTEASYLCLPGPAKSRLGVKRLIRRMSETVVGKLGSFLILEIWSADDRVETDPLTGETLLPQPEFRILIRRPNRPEGTVATLDFALQEIRIHRRSAKVEIDLNAKNHPARMTELISEPIERRIGCHVFGLEIRPVFRDPDSGEVYDRVMRSFGRQVSHALKKAFFRFSLKRTELRPEHYFAFGASRLSKQALAIDRQLTELSKEFKFLLLVTPINAQRAWKDFEDNNYRKTPVFHYRPLNADPLLIKRRLMKIATERVEDPTLSYILRQTQYELDRQVNMLADIGTSSFLPGSLQVFDSVKPKLRRLADGILRSLANPDPRNDESVMLTARAFARLADKEIKYYRDQSAAFAAQAITRGDIYTGLMVSGGNLWIGQQTRIAKSRANALLQHEVGTHLVTYYNGASQPLRLLQVGLAGYDALQEGLAVLAEYLVGGLSASRMRTLAARVIAVDQMVHDTPFPDVFAQLVDEFHFEPRTAYTIALRVFRGGGLTKDALYLRGLVEIIDYIGGGGELEPLLVGKIAVEHVPIIHELLLSGALRSPPLRPRYLLSPDVRSRLDGITSATSVLDLISPSSNDSRRDATRVDT